MVIRQGPEPLDQSFTAAKIIPTRSSIIWLGSNGCNCKRPLKLEQSERAIADATGRRQLNTKDVARQRYFRNRLILANETDILPGEIIFLWREIYWRLVFYRRRTSSRRSPDAGAWLSFCNRSPKYYNHLTVTVQQARDWGSGLALRTPCR